METTSSEIVMHVTRGCLVVPVPAALPDDASIEIQKAVLEMLGRKRVGGVIIDVSAVAILDSYLAEALVDTVEMASLMGAAAVVTGMKPGIAASLVDLGCELKGVRTAATLEDGFRILEPAASPGEGLEEAAAEDAGAPAPEDEEEEETAAEDDGEPAADEDDAEEDDEDEGAEGPDDGR